MSSQAPNITTWITQDWLILKELVENATLKCCGASATLKIVIDDPTSYSKMLKRE